MVKSIHATRFRPDSNSPDQATRYVPETSEFAGLSPSYNGIHVGIGTIVIKAERIEFTVKSRAADLQPPRDLRHLPAIMCNRETNDLGFDLVQWAHFAITVGEGERWQS